MMRRADFASEAEYYRAHREAFLLAQELGCTPKEAEDELRRRQAFARDREATRRLAAKRNAPCSRELASRAGHEPDEAPVPYWQRD